MNSKIELVKKYTIPTLLSGLYIGWFSFLMFFYLKYHASYIDRIIWNLIIFSGILISSVLIYFLVDPLLKRKNVVIPESIHLNIAQIVVFSFFSLIFMLWLGLYSNGIGFFLSYKEIISFLYKSILYMAKPVLIVIVSTIYFVAIGRRIILLSRLKINSTLEHTVLSYALGIFFLMVIMTILGFAELFYRSIILWMIAGITVLFYKDLVSVLKNLFRSNIILNIKPKTFNAKINLFSIIIVYLFVLYMVISAFQDTPKEFDSLTAYLSFPKEYVLQHKIVSYPYNLIEYSPKYGEMVFTFLLFFSGFPILSLFNTVTFLFIFGVMLLIYRQFSYTKESSSIFLYSSFLIPLISYLASIGIKVDILHLLFTLLSVLYLLMYSHSKHISNYFLLSLFLGVSLGIKYTSLFTIIAFLVIIAFLHKNEIKTLVQRSALLLGIVTLIFLPWGARNTYLSGNPVAPIFFERLNNGKTFFNKFGPNTVQTLIQEDHDESSLFTANKERQSLKQFFTKPFVLSVNPPPPASYMFNISVIFLTNSFLLLPLLARNKHLDPIIKRKRYIVLFLIVFLYTILLTAFEAYPWYALSLFPLLLILYQVSLDDLQNKGLLRTIIIITCLNNIIIFLAWVFGFYSLFKIPGVLMPSGEQISRVPLFMEYTLTLVKNIYITLTLPVLAFVAILVFILKYSFKRLSVILYSFGWVYISIYILFILSLIYSYPSDSKSFDSFNNASASEYVNLHDDYISLGYTINNLDLAPDEKVLSLYYPQPTYYVQNFNTKFINNGTNYFELFSRRGKTIDELYETLKSLHIRYIIHDQNLEKALNNLYENSKLDFPTRSETLIQRSHFIHQFAEKYLKENIYEYPNTSRSLKIYKLY